MDGVLAGSRAFRRLVRGDYYVIGYGGALDLDIDIISREINVIGNLVGTYRDLVDLMTLTAQGKVSLETSVYDLDAYADAINDVEEGRLVGRGILVPEYHRLVRCSKANEHRVHRRRPRHRLSRRCCLSNVSGWHKMPVEVAVVATRNVVLSQHQHEFVESLVESGRYQNASEVLRDGLRLLERRELAETAKMAALRDAADKGWSDLASGHYDDIADEDLDDFIGQLGVRAERNQPTG